MLPAVDAAVPVGVELAALGLAVRPVDDDGLGAAVAVAVLEEALDAAVRAVEGLVLLLLDQTVAARQTARRSLDVAAGEGEERESGSYVTDSRCVPGN